MSKHTPGPWVVSQAHGFHSGKPTGTFTINGACGTVATLPNPRIEANEANARLIVAAPTMLDALLRLNALGALHSRPEYGSEYNEVLAFCRAAIDKATGSAA